MPDKFVCHTINALDAEVNGNELMIVVVACALLHRLDEESAALEQSAAISEFYASVVGSETSFSAIVLTAAISDALARVPFSALFTHCRSSAATKPLTV